MVTAATENLFSEGLRAVLNKKHVEQLGNVVKENWEPYGEDYTSSIEKLLI